MTNQIDVEIRKLEPSNISEFISVIDIFEDVFKMENFSKKIAFMFLLHLMVKKLWVH